MIQKKPGLAIEDICRLVGISRGTYFRWKKLYEHNELLLKGGKVVEICNNTTSNQVLRSKGGTKTKNEAITPQFAEEEKKLLDLLAELISEIIIKDLSEDNPKDSESI
jgi:transposase-like protein